MDRTAKQVLRAALKEQTKSKWGFLIYRCTYASTSQDQWNRFIAWIKEDAREYLKGPEDQDLFNSMDWTVIEDPNLDGVHWKEARDKFDAWVKTELADIEDGPSRPWVEHEAAGHGTWTHQDKLDYRFMHEPRYGYFIYVDEAAVNSVLDHAEDRDYPGGYFITLVQNGMVNQGDYGNPEIATVMAQEGEEPDETDEDYWREYRQKIHAWDIVALYATILDGGWPDDPHQGDDGIGEIVSL